MGLIIDFINALLSDNKNSNAKENLCENANEINMTQNTEENIEFSYHPFSKWVFNDSDFKKEDESSGVYFINEETGKIKTIIDKNGRFVNFPGIVEEKCRKDYYEYNVVGKSVEYHSEISKCDDGRYRLRWCIQPDGRYWGDGDGYGSDNEQEIYLYTYIDSNGDFTDPFKVYSVGMYKNSTPNSLISN